MIPTINDIVDSLIKGTMTKEQAVAYIEQHLLGEYNQGYGDGQDSMETDE